MKKLIISIVLSLFSLVIYSQTYSVNITGVVTDELTQQPISNKQILIYVDSLTSGFIYYNTVITDSNGYFNDIMEVPISKSGVVEVSTLSCDLLISQIDFFSQNTPQLIFNFDICNNPSGNNCEAYFIYDFASEPLSVEFFDESIGDIGTWLWDFGDGNASYNQNPIHNYEMEGTYMVSLYIETNDSCMSYYEDRIYVYGDTTDCNSDFNIELDTLNNIPNTYIFTDLSEGDINDWYWEFGDGNFSTEQTPTHVYTDGGTYYPCLTVTSFFGNVICSSTECKDLTTLEYFNFGGQAFIGDYPINIEPRDSSNIAIAYLYRKVNHSWHYMDQREFWEYGYYWFIEKPVGEYLIVASLTENSIDYSYYAPSYYPNATSWKNASSFILSNNQHFEVNISLHELASSTSGIGSISGMVIGGTSCDTNYNINTNHVLVQLFNSSNEIISYTYTDTDGNYEFIGLGMGNYFIKPEYTGKYTEETNILLSDGEPNLSDIQLIINCSHPLGVEESISKYIAHIGKVYPNPLINSGVIPLKIKESTSIKIGIFNQFGQVLFSNEIYLTTGNHVINLATESFTDGMYFVRITTSDNVSTVQKFIKTR